MSVYFYVYFKTALLQGGRQVKGAARAGRGRKVTKEKVNKNQRRNNREIKKRIRKVNAMTER